MIAIMFMLAGLIFSCPIIADPWSGNTPVQVFQDKNSDGSTASQPPVTPALPAAQTPAASSDQVPTQKPVATPAVSSDLSLLKTQLNQLNQNTILLSERVGQQLAQHTAQIVELQTQLKQLDQALLLLNKAVVKLQPPNMVGNYPHSSFSLVSVWLQAAPFRALIASVLGIVLAIVVVILFIRRRKRGSSALVADTADEYDYMGSSESAPAKLNLARSYIAMEDFAAADQVLTEVIEHGAPEYQQQARTLQQAISDKL